MHLNTFPILSVNNKINGCAFVMTTPGAGMLHQKQALTRTCSISLRIFTPTTASS
jgi:hypothetical protein